jgi:Integral membrane protein
MPVAYAASAPAGTIAEERDGARVLVIRPHRSLTPASARRFIFAVAVGTFAVAIFFTARYGFWPILAFAALEIVALSWAVRASMRSGMVAETITITHDQVRIEHREEGNHRFAVFPRHWARVTLHAPLAALHPSRLVVESHGRACEVGRFLTEDERRGLAVQLKQLVGNVNESPAL